MGRSRIVVILIFTCGLKSCSDPCSLLFAASKWSHQHENHTYWTAESRQQSSIAVPIVAFNAVVVPAKFPGSQPRLDEIKEALDVAATTTQDSVPYNPQKRWISRPQLPSCIHPSFRFRLTWNLQMTAYSGGGGGGWIRPRWSAVVATVTDRLGIVLRGSQVQKWQSKNRTVQWFTLWSFS